MGGCRLPLVIAKIFSAPLETKIHFANFFDVITDDDRAPNGPGLS